MTGTREGVVVDFTTTDTVPLHPLGTELNGLDGNTYVYVSGAATSTYLYFLDENSAIAGGITNTSAGITPKRVVVPQTTIGSGQYGWAITKGLSFTVRALANCAADVKLYTTAAATGFVDDSATSAVLVQGLRLNESVGGSNGTANATATSYMRCNAQD